MISAFKTSYKLKITYKVNGIIYAIKKIPLIKKLLPAELYKSKGLKTFALILCILWEVLGNFLGKALYVYTMVLIPLAFLKVNPGEGFTHIFMFLTINGAVMNSNMFNPSKDKYYAIFLMRMDARKYVLSNYYYFLVKTFVGLTPFLILFGRVQQVPIWLCIMLGIFIVCIKGLYNALVLWNIKRTKKVYNENAVTPVRWTIIGAMLVIGYGLPFMGMAISEALAIALIIAVIVCAVPAFIYMNRYTGYKKIYKAILSKENVIFDVNAYIKEANKQTAEKQIDNTVVKVEGKEGYGYFHEIFVRRHRKILTRSAKRTALTLTAIVAVAFIGVVNSTTISAGVNRMMLVYLPYFLFIMYMINKGQVITQAMFMNCDHSMLTYRFYRQPKDILGLFKKRLKTVVAINLFPALVIAIGLPVLLYASGGTNEPLNYLVLFLSIIFMSVFFSVHHLVLYYLLQPYNANVEVKSATYSIITSGTYLVVFLVMEIKLPTVIFGSCIIGFTILYVAVALFLAYKYAPRTFKLK